MIHRGLCKDSFDAVQVASDTDIVWKGYNTGRGTHSFWFLPPKNRIVFTFWVYLRIPGELFHMLSKLAFQIEKIDSLHQRLRLVKASLILAFLFGVLLSLPLWTNQGRIFPVIKPFDITPILSSVLNIAFLMTFVGFGVGWIFQEKRWFGLISISSLAIVLVQDQMRWQPWVYLYLLMLLPFFSQATEARKERPIFAVLQLIVAGVYVWSGLHKFNYNFIDTTFTQMLNAAGFKKMAGEWENLGLIIPCLELAMGLALVTQRFRKIGMYGAIFMHVAILFYLSPFVLNFNSVILPWNVAMIVFLILLFGGTDNNPLTFVSDVRKSVAMLVPIALVWIVPIFNFFGYWDHYMSFSFYSGKPSKFFIAIEVNELEKIDKRFKNYFAEIPGLQGGQLIEIDKWSFAELNVPFYPEKRLFRKLSLKFCEFGIASDKLVFLELSTSGRRPSFNKFTCTDLNTE